MLLHRFTASLPRPGPGLRVLLIAALAVLCAVLQGCANTVHSQMLASGHPQQAAYALSGPDLPTLRQEALRLCGGGADVVREGMRSEQAPPAQGRLGRWWQLALQGIEPPLQQAQLVVRCDLRPEAQRLGSLPLPPVASLKPVVATPRRSSRSRPIDADVPYGF